ncbi:MAG: YjbH domain-containing protein, partial [Alphaproteobacteria bacterium]
MGLRSVGLLAGVVAAVFAGAAMVLPRQAEPAPLSLYGMTGVIDTPSARVMDDGELAITGEIKKPDDRITIAFQALPWLEATARYSIINNFDGPGATLYDRSLGLKLKLMNEGQYRPALAVGILDIGGTEVFGGEYFVTSKRFGPFDASLGLGFGRLGSVGMFANPFGVLSKKFYTRPPISGINGTGQFALKDFFRGHDTSLFGGVVYNTPIQGLQLLAEYSGDDYVSEQARGLVKIRTPINAGLSYRPIRNLELGAYWTYGSQLALRLSIRGSLVNGDKGQKLDPPPVPIHVRTEDEIEHGKIESALNVDPKSLVPLNRKAAQALLKRASQDQLYNGPDIEVDDRPLGDEATVWASKFETLDPRLADAPEVAHIRAQLEALNMTLESFGVEDTQAVISVVPKTGQAPLPCEVMWHQISVGKLNGVEAITFINSAGGREVNRCTKFVDHNETQIAEPARSGIAGVQLVSDTSVSDDARGESESIASNDEDVRKLAKQIRNVFAYQGLALEGFKLNGTNAIIYLNNVSYQRVGRALGRAARALTALLPPKVEMLTIIETNGAIMGAEFTIPRTELERVATSGGSAEEILASSSPSPAPAKFAPDLDYKRNRVLKFSPVLAPAFRQSLFDPDNPFRYQFLIRAGGTLQLMRGLGLEGIYDINLYNDFNTIKRVSDSVLPHVRSDFRYYLQQGASGIETLQLFLIHQFAPSWTGRLSAGYLEQMYGGVSGEILYAPFRQRWAIG